MKEKIMKLSVLVGICAIALFIMVGMASADPPYSIRGVYATTGLDTCNPVSSIEPVSPGIMEADWTFRHDGTGSIDNAVVRNLPPGPFFAIRGDFTYTVTKEGRIEFQYPFPPGGLRVGSIDGNGEFIVFMTLNAGPSHGVISPDHKTITISCGPPVGPLWAIDPAGDKIPGTEMWCITSVTGMRIR
jgi:hypothetical protein